VTRIEKQEMGDGAEWGMATVTRRSTTCRSRPNRDELLAASGSVMEARARTRGSDAVCLQGVNLEQRSAVTSPRINLQISS